MFLILFSALIIAQTSALSEQDFRENLENKCFEGNVLSWNPENATSIENFIYIVEKLERNIDIKTEDLVRELLLRFSCNRLKLNEDDLRDQTGRYFEKIMSQFLLDGKQNDMLHSLTEKEGCQLFFMLSPAILERKENDYRDEENKFYEYGVVSLNSDKERTIDLSKVLFGIFAGFQSGKTTTVKSLLDEKYDKAHADENVDMLYALTISEVINTVVEKQATFDVENFHKGSWTSTICTKEYMYDKEVTWPTTAEIVGGVDGFILGSKIRNMENKNNIKLSQILRMYYSKEGFKKDAVDQSAASYCNRGHDHFERTELEKQTINYMVVYRILTGKTAMDKDEDRIKNALEAFRRSEILQKTEAEQEDCKEEISTGGKNKDTCETLSSVFVFLDQQNGNLTAQKSLLGKLINELNIGLDEDTVTIYSNEDIENLRLIVNVSDSKGHAACTLQDFKPSGNTANDAKVLTDLKNILISFEENQESLLAVPAKVVVMFNFGDLKNEEKGNLDKAARELKSRHPHLTIFPIGSNAEYLRTYFVNRQPRNFLQWNDLNSIADLKKRICEVPAVLQYRNCKTKSSFQETEYTGYVRDFHVQHWAMYPKDFLKTFGYKFQFKAQYGGIRVCFSRTQPITDSGNSTKCQVTTTERNTLEFKDSDPCKGRTVHNCQPFYFSIFGRSSSEGEVCKREIDGRDIGCKTLDQIAYTISHEGISCNSAKQLISSPLFQTLLALLITFHVLAWKK